MNNNLLGVTLNLIKTGNMLAFAVIVIWAFLTLTGNFKPERPNPYDFVINFVKACVYLFLAYASCKVYSNAKYVNDIKDLVSGFAYVLSLLEGMHCTLNSVGIYIIRFITPNREL